MKLGKILTAGLAAAGCALLMAGPAYAVAGGSSPSLACIDKSVNATEIPINSPVEYTITLDPGGTGTVENVMLTDPVPTEVTGVTATVLGGADVCSDTQTVICNFGDLSASADPITVQIMGLLTGGAAGDLIGNTATVSSDNVTPNPASCSAFFTIPDTPDEVLACRVTGGGVNKDGDPIMANGSMRMSRGVNRYTFGGQAGANTASLPEPSGEWTHHQQFGPDGMFVFHAGTASAPEATEISVIECSDPGFCNPARPAPAKQINFAGVGSFKNIKDSPDVDPDVTVGVSLHWFTVDIDDLGEPGNNGKQPKPGAMCPIEGVDGPGGEFADCDCPDYYKITIHKTADPLSDVIYTVRGYIDGGNLQIHPPTGFDTQASN